MRGDRGDIVLGWLTRLTVVLGILGVIGFDVAAVAIANVSAADTAASAARIGVQEYRTSQDAKRAFLASSGYATDRSLELAEEDFHVDPTTGAVTVTLHKHTETIVFKHIGFLKKKADVSKTATAERPK